VLTVSVGRSDGSFSLKIVPSSLGDLAGEKGHCQNITIQQFDTGTINETNQELYARLSLREGEERSNGSGLDCDLCVFCGG
jgi:hypothetical protein